MLESQQTEIEKLKTAVQLRKMLESQQKEIEKLRTIVQKNDKFFNSTGMKLLEMTLGTGILGCSLITY